MPGSWAKLRTPTRRQTPPTVIELERGVYVPNKGDDAALASLKNHPGIMALLNRFRLQRAVLEAKLKTQRFKELRDADILQLGITWLGIVESEIRNATKNLEDKTVRAATFDEEAEFKKALSAIEGVGHTTPE